jgi:23S rRNA (cytosine1962-C5)-methyltransferase
MLPVVTLVRGAGPRLRAGHPWVYPADIAGVQGEPAPGGLVAVATAEGSRLGPGWYSPASRVRVRLFPVLPGETIEDDAEIPGLLRRRLAAAASLRSALGYDPVAGAARMVFGESDGLPGLVVDRYGRVMVIQLLSAGMDRLRPAIVAALMESGNTVAVVERSESGSREREGLPPARGLLAGELLPGGLAPFRAGDLDLDADVLEGQKTGFYLDQRDTWIALRELARGRRVLDVCCYLGAAGLSMLRGGAASLLGIDTSRRAVGIAATLAARNGLGDRARFTVADAGEEMARLAAAGEQYDLVFLDPSAFAKARAHRTASLRAYAALNAAAIAVTAPDGLLVTCSCTPWVGAAELADIVDAAARRAGRGVTMLEIRGQARDHPPHPRMPETRYLTSVVWHIR